MGRYSAGGVIGRDGHKEEAQKALFEWAHEEVHVGAYDPKVRLEVLDECGIDAQIIFPNTIGLGGQDLGAVEDQVLRRLAVEIYNDARAEMQAESGNRLLPLPVMPAWDIDACVLEAKRVAAPGRPRRQHDLGPAMTSARRTSPTAPGTRSGRSARSCELPVHFHIGASVTGMNFYGKYFWPSHPDNTKLAIGGSLLFIGNARVVTNLILAGIFDRHPGLKAVSVESGVGWIPFILETLDYEMAENAPRELAQLKKPPSEYFRSQHLRDVLVRERPEQAAGPDRGGRRGQHPLRDRLPAPHVPLPVAVGHRRAEDAHPVRRRSAQDHG